MGILGIGATIRIGREMLCLPYAGFFFKIIVAPLVPYIYLASGDKVCLLSNYLAGEGELLGGTQHCRHCATLKIRGGEIFVVILSKLAIIFL